MQLDYNKTNFPFNCNYGWETSQSNPVTMVVLATGHQVHCILWEQVTIFNKGIDFLCGLKFFALSIYLRRILATNSMFDVANPLKISVKDVPMNNYELLNIQACSFLMFRNRGCTQSLVVSCKYWVVPLISTRASAIVRSFYWDAWYWTQ